MVPKVANLGYLIFEASDLAAWRSFAESILGLMVSERADSDALSVRMDGHEQRLGLEPGPADDLVAAGFEVADRSTLDELTQRLQAERFDVQTCDAEAAARRGVQTLVRTEDPNGLAIELFCNPVRSETPFVSELVPGGFVTAEEGLGHFVLNAVDRAATEHFYRDVLGMRLSDRIAIPVAPGKTIDIDFYHVNARHHTLAFAITGMPKRIHHFMIEAQDGDAVGLAYDRVQDAGVPIMSTLGRHTNDRMTSFYAQTPSGFQVEFGWGGIKVDDESWKVRHYDSGSIWGHRMPSRPESTTG